MMTLRKYLPIILPLFLLTPSAVLAATAEAPGWFAETVWYLVNNFFGLFVGLAGYLLDYGVNTFVIGFGHEFLSSGLGAIIDQLWSNIRDIFNITFIFGLVYIGFKMILNSDDSGTKRGLIYLIMAALLVNFSLYITKFVIDLSNILATQIAVGGFDIDPATGGVAISETLMRHFGISSVLTASSELVGGKGVWGYIFGTAILYIVAMFVFAAGGIMLTIRFAALCLYMVFSPLMFLGWVFPQMQGVTSKYWKGFLGRAFYAPLYILMVYFAVSIVSLYFGGRKPEFGEILSGKTSPSAMEETFATTIPPFVLSVIFLIAAVVLSNKLGADGASAALRIGNNLRGKMQRGVGRFAGGATAGVGASLLRNTAGRYANSKLDDENFKRRMASSALGRQVFKATSGVAGASFDARRIGGVGTAMGIGDGVAGGYSKSVADNNAADEKFLNAIKANVDLNDPEVQAKINERADKIADEANTAAKVDAADAEALAEMKNKTEAELKAMVEAEKQRIATEEAKYRSEESAGRMPAEDLKKLAVAITESKTKLAVKEEARKRVAGGVAVYATKREEVQNSKSDLETRRANAVANSDTAEAEKIQKEIEAADKELTKLDKNYDKVVKATEARAQSLIARAKTASKYAESEVKYANEIAYMKHLEDSEKFWKGESFTGAATSTAAAAGGATYAGSAATALLGAGLLSGGAIIAGSALGAFTANARGDRNRLSRENLARKYGQDGMKMADNEAQKKQFGLLAEVLRDQEKQNSGGGTVNPPPAAPNPA